MGYNDDSKYKNCVVKVDPSDVCTLLKYGDVKLLMDRDTFNLYYEIDFDSLESKISQEELDKLYENGWFLDEDESNGKKIKKLKVFWK